MLRALCRRALPSLLCVVLAGAAAAEECAPWAGEPDPLPSRGAEDPLLERWATLRAGELAERARAAEGREALAAYVLWRRVRCLDPANEEAARASERMRPLRLHRPEIAPAWRVREAPVAGPWEGLDAPIAPRPAHALRDARAPARLVQERQRELARVETLLGEADEHLRTARFERVLAVAGRARDRLDALGTGGDLRDPRLRLEVLAATASVALGQEDAARAALGRALAIDPRFELDATTTSPKVLRALDAARAERESP